MPGKAARTEKSASYLQLFAFFLPLAFQGFSAGFTYPLIAMVASRGSGGPLNHVGVSQAQTIMFFLSNICGSGLITTGMVFGKTRRGFVKFYRVNMAVAGCIGIVQLLLCIPALAHVLLANIMGLPPTIEPIAHWTLLYSIPVNMLFLIRNPYQVALYNNRSTGKASFATILRIGITMMLSPVFVFFNWVGPFWATACLTLPTVLEVLLSRHFSRKIIKDLPDTAETITPIRTVLGFNAVLSLGGGLLYMSQLILGAFIMRTPDPERIAPIYYVVAGVVNALGSGANRMQAVSLSFPPHGRKDGRMIKFALMVGLMFAMIIAALLIPPVTNWYFIQVQRLRTADLPLIVTTVMFFALCPLTVGLRSRLEGVVASKKRPGLILTGQLIYTTSIALSGWVLSSLRTSGNLLGPLGFISANLIAVAVVHMILVSKRRIRDWKRTLRMVFMRTA